MRCSRATVVVVGLLALAAPGAPGAASRQGAAGPAIASVALRVHRMPEMMAFYSEAFGIRFRAVDARGITSQFGQLGSITVKLVPIRDTVDFEGFAVHQVGFDVPDVAKVIAIARKHGGRVQDEPARLDGRLHAAIRDPDGNTVELYGPP